MTILLTVVGMLGIFYLWYKYEFEIVEWFYKIVGK